MMSMQRYISGRSKISGLFSVNGGGITTECIALFVSVNVVLEKVLFNICS